MSNWEGWRVKENKNKKMYQDVNIEDWMVGAMVYE